LKEAQRAFGNLLKEAQRAFGNRNAWTFKGNIFVAIDGEKI